MSSITQSLEDALKGYKYVSDNQLKSVAPKTVTELREAGRENVLYPFFEKILLGIEIEQPYSEYVKRCSTFGQKTLPYFGNIFKYIDKEDESVINSIIKNRMHNSRVSDEIYYHSIVRYMNEKKLYEKVAELGLNGIVDSNPLNSRELIFKNEENLDESDFSKVDGFNRALIFPKKFDIFGNDFNRPFYKLQKIIANFNEMVSPQQIKSIYDLAVDFRLNDIAQSIEATEIFTLDQRARVASEKLKNSTLNEVMLNIDYPAMISLADKLDRENYSQLSQEERIKLLVSLDSLIMKGYANSSINQDIRRGYQRGLIGRGIYHNDVLARLISSKK